MATRRRFGGGGGRFKPPTDWASINSAVQTNVGAASKVLLGSFSSSLGTETVRRTRGLLSWSSDQQTASEFVPGAFGMCVVSLDAFTAGVASLLGPVSDAGSDLWFVHQWMMFDLRFASGVGLEPHFDRQYEFDSKAMRRVTEEERVVLVVENAHASSGAAFNFQIRLLGSLSRG